MKRIWIHLALAALAGAAYPLAAADEPFAGVTFRTYVAPLFPQMLKFEGITSGFVEIVVDINPDGTIADWLPIRANHPRFVQSIEYVIDDWLFNPPLSGGEPVPAVQRFTFNFSHEGIVLISGNLTDIYLSRLSAGKEILELVAVMKDLDQIPEPVEIVRPALNPAIPPEERAGTVVISFYIDKEGKVRIPVVKELKVHRGLAEAAFAALSQWRFKPPTRHGKPVVVEVQQPFHFRDTPVPADQVRD